MKLDAQVDMLEFKEYAEIDLNETPVVALACGHFFTAETLDGTYGFRSMTPYLHSLPVKIVYMAIFYCVNSAGLTISHLGMVGLKEVYTIDPGTSKSLGLEDISSRMAPAIPKCPHCQRPIRQHVTRRYNRLINRAVIDEMSKRFIVTGQTDLQEIEEKLTKVDLDLEQTRSSVTSTGMMTISPHARERAIGEVTRKLELRYKACSQLISTVKRLQCRTAERHQPAHKLHEATLHALRRDIPLEGTLRTLTLEHSPSTDARDQRITLGAKMLQAKIECLVLEDKFSVLSDTRKKHGNSVATSMLGNSPSSLTTRFLQFCTEFITTCSKNSSPRLAVEASLYYARVARLFETSGITEPKDRELATKYHDKAQMLLEEAGKLCEQGFRDAGSLLQAVIKSLKLLQKEWYEGITTEELASIKTAMVSGSHGIAAHSGHWYNCVNGHPVCFTLYSWCMKSGSADQ